MSESLVRERTLAEELWLNWFNRYLLEQSVISQREHSRMTALIAERRRHSGTKY